MNEYVIKDDEHRAQVEGSLKEDGFVKVKYNGELFEFHSGKGNFETGAVSAELKCPDGSYVKEGAVTQEIKLPNGVRIESGAAEDQMFLPNGKEISNWDEEDATVINDGSVKIKIRSNKSSRSVSTNFDMSIFSSEDSDSSNSDNEVSKESTKEDKTELVSDKDLIESLTPGVFTLALILYGLFTSSSGALMIGVFIYLIFSVPTLISYTLQSVLKVKDNTSKETKQNEENQIEEIKDMYASGNIDEQELEEKLEKEISDDKEVEVETN